MKEDSRALPRWDFCHVESELEDVVHEKWDFWMHVFLKRYVKWKNYLKAYTFLYFKNDSVGEEFNLHWEKMVSPKATNA